MIEISEQEAIVLELIIKQDAKKPESLTSIQKATGFSIKRIKDSAAILVKKKAVKKYEKLWRWRALVSMKQVRIIEEAPTAKYTEAQLEGMRELGINLKINPEQKKFILENYDKMSRKEMRTVLGFKNKVAFNMILIDLGVVD